MDEDKDSSPDIIRLANDSGFPLQMAIAHEVKRSFTQHGWSVAYREHAWTNTEDQTTGFIDLVLQDSNHSVFMVVESKRVTDATWLFLREKSQANTQRRVKTFVSHSGESRSIAFGWQDTPFEPASSEAMFCAIRGQSANERQTLLERIGSELISATQGFAQEQREYRPALESLRHYVNVIVTTADLKLAEIEPQTIALGSGKFKTPPLTQSIPFLRFRKQMGKRVDMATQEDFRNRANLADRREHTVFVVNSMSLEQFLSEFALVSDARTVRY